MTITLVANYLDDKTAKLDKLIKNKKDQIEKLKEIQQIEINNAVTKGLNQKAKMKPLGIEWLGDIPEHWIVRRIKNLSSLSNEKVIDFDDDEFLIALENIESWTGRYVDTSVEFEGGGMRFNENDVLFGKLRPYLAKVLHINKTGVCVSEILAIRQGNSIYGKFLFYRMLSIDFILIINSSTFGAKMPIANWSFISNLKMPFPGINEQRSIVDSIYYKFEKVTKLIDSITNQIEQLLEIRKIEIYNSVTGKIKVV